MPSFCQIKSSTSVLNYYRCNAVSRCQMLFSVGRRIVFFSSSSLENYTKVSKIADILPVTDTISIYRKNRYLKCRYPYDTDIIDIGYISAIFRCIDPALEVTHTIHYTCFDRCYYVSGISSSSSSKCRASWPRSRQLLSPEDSRDAIHDNIDLSAANTSRIQVKRCFCNVAFLHRPILCFNRHRNRNPNHVNLKGKNII